MLTANDAWAGMEACPVIRTHKRTQGIHCLAARFVDDGNTLCIHFRHLTILFREKRTSTLTSHQTLQSCPHYPRLWPDKGNRLALHIGAHGCTGVVIVLKKGDQ